MSNSGIDLHGRVAIVTGGSRGIGRATAERLAECGASVVVNYHHNKAAAMDVVRACTERRVDALAVAGDVARLRDAEEIIEQTVARFGKVDLLVCNAGIWQGTSVEEISEELWDRVIDTNLRGTWTVCRATVPHMKRRRSGRIVVVSSTAGQRGEAGVSNYAASKGGQISFVKSLAVELAPYGVTINCVAPGWVDTELNDQVFADAEFKLKIEDGIPLGRVASADDIAYPIVFLCSDWARHITGEVLNINGGSVLCG